MSIVSCHFKLMFSVCWNLNLNAFKNIMTFSVINYFGFIFIQWVYLCILQITRLLMIIKRVFKAKINDARPQILFVDIASLPKFHLLKWLSCWSGLLFFRINRNGQCMSINDVRITYSIILLCFMQSYLFNLKLKVMLQLYKINSLT
jgi:hypothetical protein